MDMNTIRHEQNDEPATEGRSHDQGPRETEAVTEAVCVVGDSMSGKGDGVTTGDLSGQTPSDGDSAGVRAAVVAMKPGNAGGAKGGRKRDWERDGMDVRQHRSIARSARTCAAEEAPTYIERPVQWNKQLPSKESALLGWRRHHCPAEARKGFAGNLATGEPYAGEPHVRFGGRGGANQCVVPTPMCAVKRHNLPR